MRKLFLFLLIVLICLFGILQVVRKKVVHDLSQPIKESIITPSPTLVVEKNNATQKLLFVPYWTITSDNTVQLDEGYDRYLYFGVTPGTDGLQNEIGMQKADQFVQMVPEGKKKFLVLRMVDSTSNATILKDTSLQNKIISQTKSFAIKTHFDGVILDLEMSAIPFSSTIQQISTFSQKLAKQIKDAQLSYGVTLYGDTFYRVRPFEVKDYTAQADEILLMAYDFHKAGGNPGPNFPLNGKESYGYDMKKMTDDFLRVVPSRKVTVIFGMYGYDWQIDKNGKAVGIGSVLTLSQIQKTLIDTCKYSDCHVTKDTLSAETKITYVDNENNRHVVWFEDMKSVSEKQTYLKSMGIVQYAYWAYSYFQ